MKFMNKKEDVLDIRMTPYGEYLLSQGRFKPEYYAFYDDNILYETLYTNPTNTTAAATATWTFTDKANEETTITITDAAGTSVVFEVDNGTGVGDGVATAGATPMDPATNNAAGMGDIMASVVNASALEITATTDGSGKVTLTQDVKGTAGNTAITLSNYANWDANTSDTFPTTFSGGTDLPSEDQNNIEPRIQEDTPQLTTQVVFSDRDMFVRKGLSDLLGEFDPDNDEFILEGVIEQEDKVSITSEYFDRHRYGPQHSLGTSDILKTNAPALSVSMLRGEITGSARAVTGSTTHTMNIPQLDVTLTYKINVVNGARLVSDSVLAVEYPNGQFLDIKPEIVLSQVIERNAEFTKENFDIEVFEVMEGALPGMETTTEKLRPLRFRKPRNLVQGGILLDDDEIPETPETSPGNRSVEYYFDIRTDEDINEQLICSSISVLESKGLYVDTEIVCEDVKNISLVDIYSTDASSEPCPEDGPGGGDPCAETGSVY